MDENRLTKKIFNYDYSMPGAKSWFSDVKTILKKVDLLTIDFELKKVLLPPLGNFADISYLKENFKPHILRDVCTLCSGALVSDSLLHMLL